MGSHLLKCALPDSIAPGTRESAEVFLWQLGIELLSTLGALGMLATARVA
jgi:hypothetical protein